MSRIYHIGITNINITSVPHWFHIGAPRAIFVFNIIITSISHQHHNTIISTSHQYQVIITTISHPYHNNFTSIAHQYRKDITSVAYQYHIKLTTISRSTSHPYHQYHIGITLVSHWSAAGIFFSTGRPGTSQDTPRATSRATSREPWSAAGNFFPRDVPGRPRIRHARRPASLPELNVSHTTSASLPGRKSLQEETMQSRLTKFFTGKTGRFCTLFLS